MKIWKNKRIHIRSFLLAVIIFHPSILAADPIFTSTFGTAGTGNGQFNFPYSIAENAAGSLYVTDSVNNRIEQFDSVNTFVSTFGTSGNGNGQFNNPLGMTINGINGNIIIVDENNNRVQIFNSNNTFNSTFGTFGGGNGQFDNPIDVATNALGQIYVTDINAGRIQLFTSAGVYADQFPIFGTLGVTINNNLGRLYTTVFTDSVAMFQSTNPFTTQGTFGFAGAGNGQFASPQGIALDNSSGNVYVADAGNNRIQVFDPVGNFLSTFGTSGTGDGQFNNPTDVLVQNTTGKIYVVDSLNNRVQVFFDPTVWTQAGTSNLLSLNLNQNLTLNPGFNLNVLYVNGGTGNTSLLAGVNLTLNGGAFTTTSLTMTGGSITDQVNSTLNFPLILTNGTFNSVAGNTFTYGGGISDNGVPGVLTIGGPGTVVLSGTSTYTGGTFLNGGTTRISADSNLGAASGPLTFNGGILETTASLASARNVTLNPGGGTFQIDTGLTTLSGTIGGPGSLTIGGLGTVVLFGANTYSGGTFLNGGTTRINADSNLGTASGPLTFNGGILETTTSLASARNVTLNLGGGTFQVDRGITTLSGTLGGTGSLTKTGLGILDLVGTNSYTGNTFVNQGIFSLRSALPNSAVSVAPGTFITGTGSMKSLNLSGTISPGNFVGTGSPIGTLTITNNFTMNPTATYLAQVNSDGTSDLITVGGTAQLNGTLSLITNSPAQYTPGQTFTILTAAQGITGQFTSILTPNRIRVVVQYLPTSLKVVIGALQNALKNFADAFNPKDKSNAARTARYFDTFANNTAAGSDLSKVIQVLDGYLDAGNIAGLKSALNQIEPSLFREFGFVSFAQATLLNKTVRTQQQYRREGVWKKDIEGISAIRLALFNRLVENQPMKGFLSENLSNGTGKPKKKGLAFAQDEGNIRGAPVAQRVRNELTSMWIQPYGQVNDKGRNSHGGTRNGNVGIKSHTSGFSLGGDVQLCRNTFVGLLGGYSNTPFHWRAHRGNGHMHSTNLGVYGTWMDEGLYVDGQVIGGNNRFKSWRKIAFGSINRTARESHRAFQLSTDGEIGYAMALPCFTFQPFINLDYILVHENSYREKGAQSLNLNIKSKTAQFLQGEIGATIYHTYVACDVLIRPAFQVGFIQKRPFEHNGPVKGGLVGQSQTLTVIGDNRVRNQFAPAVSLTAQFPNGFNMTANVSAEVFDGQNSGEALLRLGYDF